MRFVFLAGLLMLLLAACAQATPTPLPAGNLVFDMQQEYRLGEPVEVAIRNDSSVTYYFQSEYPACYNLQFFDDSQEIRPYPNADPVSTQSYLLPGEFIVPRGTHCDLIVEGSLDPGQAVVLFTWKQQMCIEDRFGCRESVPVGPGQYLFQGEFANAPSVIGPGSERRPDAITTITWDFTIQSP